MIIPLLSIRLGIKKTNMKKKLLLWLIVNLLFSQSQGDYWYFGSKAGLQFNNNAVSVLYNGEINTREGCTAISNVEGELLFYSDGKQVYNQNHDLLQNGSGLLGDPSSTQSAVAVPMPGTYNASLHQFDKYYLFTVDYFESNNGVTYSIINMSLDGGLGGITNSQKNIFLAPSKAEKIAILRHQNNCDYWIVIINTNTMKFNSFLLSSSGVSSQPVSSNLTLLNISEPTLGFGYMKGSRDNSLIAFADRKQGLQLYNFNNATGTLEYRYGHLPPDPQLAYGIEFSPDGSKLYSSNLRTSHTFQYDLQTTTLTQFLDSRVSIGQNTEPPVQGLDYVAALQLAPNGKIYQTNCSSKFLNVINNPNASGMAANYQTNAIDLYPKIAEYGLPYYPISYTLENSIAISDVYCTAQTIYFSLANPYFDSAEWEIRDESNGSILYSGSEIEFDLNIAQTGIYIVKASLTICNQVYEVIKEFEVTDPISPHVFCSDSSDSYVLFAWDTLSGIDTYEYAYSINGATAIQGTTSDHEVLVDNLQYGDEVQLLLLPITDNLCYAQSEWNCPTTCPDLEVSGITNNSPICEGDAAQFTIYATPNTYVLYSLNGATSDTLQINNGMEIIEIPQANQNTNLEVHSIHFLDCEVSLSLESNVEVQIIPLENQELIICENDSILLSENPTYDSYIWRDDLQNIISNESSVWIGEVGQYSLEVTQGECTAYAQYIIDQEAIPEISLENTESSISIITLGGNPPYQYQLEDSEGNILIPFQQEPEFTNLEYGHYVIKVQSLAYQCNYLEDIYLYVIANVITPNQDGINDFWDLSFLQQFPNSYVLIFDRYGKLIKSLNENTGFIWQGQYISRNLPTSSYWYKIYIDESQIIKGYLLIKNRK